MKANNKRVATAAIQVIILTVIMKFAAFIKQAALANCFGASIDLDLYLLSADTLGDFSAALFSAVSVSVMTLYTRYKVQDERKTADRVVNTAITIFLPISILFAGIFYFFSNQLSAILAMNYSVTEQRIIAQYIRWISPTIIFLCITYMFVAVLDAHKRFWPGKLINFTLSVFIIVTTIFFGGKHGAFVLAIAYTAAYFVHMMIVWWCGKNYVRFRLVSLKKNQYVRPLLIMFLPMILGNAAIEINALIDKLLATGFGGGALASQTYGATLNSFVVSILIMAPASVLISYLTEFFAKENKEDVVALLEKYILITIAVVLPVSIVALKNAKNIVSIVYKRGAFDEKAVEQTTYVLYGYAIGFVFVAIREILIKAHLANRDSKTVTINSVISIGLNIVLSIILSQQIGIIGISLATTIASFFAMCLCIGTIRKHLPKINDNNFKKELMKLTLAGIAALGSTSIVSCLRIENHIIDLIMSTVIVFFSEVIVLMVLKSKICMIAKNGYMQILIKVKR